MANYKLKEILCVLYSILLFLSGLALIVLAFILSYKTFYHFTFTPSSTLGPLILLFVLGIVHLFATWLGVNSPLRANNVHVILFIVITILLLISELTIGIWSMVLWGEVGSLSLDFQTRSFGEMRKDCNLKSWTKLQREFECCGMNGVGDYDKEACKLSCMDSESYNNTLQNYYKIGCQDVYIAYIKGILVEGAIIGFTAAIFQALGVFLFCIYYRSLREERQKHRERLSTRQASASSGHHQPGPDTPLVYSITPLDNPPPSSPQTSSPPPSSPPVVQA